MIVAEEDTSATIFLTFLLLTAPLKSRIAAFLSPLFAFK